MDWIMFEPRAAKHVLSTTFNKHTKKIEINNNENDKENDKNRCNNTTEDVDVVYVHNVVQVFEISDTSFILPSETVEPADVIGKVLKNKVNDDECNDNGNNQQDLSNNSDDDVQFIPNVVQVFEISDTCIDEISFNISNMSIYDQFADASEFNKRAKSTPIKASVTKLPLIREEAMVPVEEILLPLGESKILPAILKPSSFIIANTPTLLVEKMPPLPDDNFADDNEVADLPNNAEPVKPQFIPSDSPLWNGKTRKKRNPPKYHYPQKTVCLPYLIKSIISNQKETKYWNMKYSCNMIFDIHHGSIEYETVTDYFTKYDNQYDYIILKVERVQNPTLMAAFIMKRQELVATKPTLPVHTKLLFHATTFSTSQTIISENFDWRMADLSRGHKHGHGTCFSPFSDFATQFGAPSGDNVYHTLLCHVLVRKSKVGNIDMVLPGEGYDASCSNDGKVIVKYHDNTAYPAYRISYRRCEKYHDDIDMLRNNWYYGNQFTNNYTAFNEKYSQYQFSKNYNQYQCNKNWDSHKKYQFNKLHSQGNNYNCDKSRYQGKSYRKKSYQHMSYNNYKKHRTQKQQYRYNTRYNPY